MNDANKLGKVDPKIQTENLVFPATNEYDVQIEKLRLEQDLEITRWKIEEQRSKAALDNTLEALRETYRGEQRKRDSFLSTLTLVTFFLTVFPPTFLQRSKSNE
jgi:hypothetical protein